MSVTINTKTTGMAELTAYLNAVQGKLKSPSRAMGDCARWARDRVKRYFVHDSARAEDGINWPDKSPFWKAIEAPKGRKSLRYSGHLANNFGAAGDATGFAYGTNVDYARIHNEGSGGKKVRIFIWLRERTGGERARSRSNREFMANYQLALPESPGAFLFGIEQRIYKREFILDPPPPSYIKHWMEILSKFYFEGEK